MRALSMRVRNWCVHWAYVLATNVCTERIPLKQCWAYASGNDAYPEYTGQELMHSLNIRVRNWCIPWAYASVSYAYAQHKHKNSIFEKVPSKHAEHAHKELMRALSLGVRNWCAGSGNISVGEESRPLQHTWNSKVFVLSRSNSLLHDHLHFQHLMKTKD